MSLEGRSLTKKEYRFGTKDEGALHVSVCDAEVTKRVIIML